VSEPRDLAAVLRLRAGVIKEIARETYNVKMREVMWQTAFVFGEAAAEIESLRSQLAEAKANTPQ